MNQIRACRGQLCFTLVLFLLILIAPFQDYTERNFTTEDMNYPEESIGIVRTEGGLMSVPDGAGSITLHSNSYYFKKGTYEATFAVTAPAAGNMVEVFDPLYLNSDNSCGRVLAEAPVIPGQDTVLVPFEIEESLSCIQFRVRTESAASFQGIYLMSERGLYRDPFIYAGLLLLGSALLFFYRSRRRIRPELLLLLAFAALWSSSPLCFPWLIRGHDMFFHYGRLFCLSEDLFSAAFPVRIHPGMFQGFGYLSPVFYPETFLYPFALLGRLGLSPIGCYRLLLLTVNSATAGVSYYAFSRLCRSRRIGLAAALFYTLSSYRLINLYTRAAVGEVLATIFLPLLLLGMYQLFYGDSRRWITAVLAFTGLLQSHMITTELAVGFAALFGLLNIRRLKDRKRLLHLLIAAGFTLFLNLWFLIPILDMMRLPMAVLGDTRNLAGYSLYGMQLFDTGLLNPAGDALGRGGIAGEMPYSIGILLLAGSLLFLLLCFRKQSRLPERHKKLGVWCLSLGALSVYASSIYFPWETIQRIELLNRIAGSIQFASRLLPFATLFLCVTAAIAVYDVFRERSARQLLLFGCTFFLVWSAGTYFSNFANTAETYVSWENQLDPVCESDALYLVTDDGAYFSMRKMKEREPVFTSSENVSLKHVSRNGSFASFSYEKSETENAWVSVPFNYYPQYHALDENGEELPTSLDKELLRLRVQLPEKEAGTVNISFQTPGLYRAGDLLSLCAAAGLIALAFLSLRERRKEN